MKNRYNQMESGGVYAITNQCIVDPHTKIPLVKIGRSGKKDVNERIAAMNKETPVPTNFTVEKIVNTPANRLVEKITHKYLEDKRYNNKKEFFTISPKDAVQEIDTISKHVEQNSNLIPDTYIPLTSAQKKEIEDAGYQPNEFFATPFSDAEYIPEANKCRDGLDNEKWKKVVKSLS